MSKDEITCWPYLQRRSINQRRLLQQGAKGHLSYFDHILSPQNDYPTQLFSAKESAVCGCLIRFCWVNLSTD